MELQNRKGIILVGNSGSGKSTFSKTVEGFRILGKDKIREYLLCSDISGCRFLQEKELLVDVFYKNQLKFHANTGINLLIDETHTTRMDFDETYRILKKNGYEVIVCLFQTPIKICLNRNKFREYSVPIEVIERKERELEQIKPYLLELEKNGLIKLERVCSEN